MKTINRRDFLKQSALGLGVITTARFLSACDTAARPTAQPISSPLPPSTAIPAAPTATDQPAATPTPSGTYLSVARGGDDPEVLVRRALAAIGGMERFVPKGTSVVIKPNMCVPAPFETGATTNPVVVATLVRMCFEAGAKSVKVLDYPFGGISDMVYEVCGVGPAVKQAGGDMEVISNVKFVKTAIPGALGLKEAFIYDDVLKADVLINVPVAKHHSLAKYTLGMKNLMGTISFREKLHSSFEKCIPDLNSVVRPTLTVVDAVRIMLQNGPTGGSPDDIKKIDTIIASHDIVAADSYGVTLFDASPADIPYISAAAQRGLGSMDLKNLKIEEINIG